MNRLRTLFRLFYLVCIALGLTLPLVGQVLAAPASQSNTGASTSVYLLRFRGAVTPVLGEYIHDGIEAAMENDAQAVILQLDTPGGSTDVTSQINQTILASPVPIVVYVAPSAARAGSAGTFITLAAHVAAMAPGSSIGAASPVGLSGEDTGATMEAKLKNILSADIENLASRRGDAAVEWAIKAVQEAAAATAEQALNMGVIDFVATDVDDLLAQMDGFVVVVQGEERRLQTANAQIRPLALSPLQQFLNFISNPSVATILLTVGSAGLIAEVWNPGTLVPGTLGLICLLLGLYALGQLEANFAGLALIVLAIVLIVAEAFTPTFGALALSGAAAFIFGSAILFDAPGLAIPWPTIIVLAVGLTAFVLLAGGAALAAQRRQPQTGSEGLIGQTATVREAFDSGGKGRVLVAGELWHAVLQEADRQERPLEKGDLVEIIARNGYTLVVKPHPTTVPAKAVT